MIYTVTLNPALDKTIYVDGFAVDEVNRVRSLREDPGGKGINVTKVVDALGGSSRALALLGGSVGRRIQDMLAAASIDCWAFEVPGETRTNTKVVDEELHTNTDINEPGPTVTAADLSAMLDALVDIVGEGDIVVLSGSLPAGAPADTYRTWVGACRDAGARVFLDASGGAFELGLEAKPYLVKPNEVEHRARGGLPRWRRRGLRGRRRRHRGVLAQGQGGLHRGLRRLRGGGAGAGLRPRHGHP